MLRAGAEGVDMRKVAVWVLSVAGVIGLLLALGFQLWKGPNGLEFRMGYPDAWVVWESTPGGGNRADVHVLRWSVLILVTTLRDLLRPATEPTETGRRLTRRDASRARASDRGRLHFPCLRGLAPGGSVMLGRKG